MSSSPVDATRRALARLARGYETAYAVTFRRQQRRALRRQEDLFRLLALSEALGIPNPASFYTLELLPFLLEDFHAWHVRMGMEHSPVDGFRCC